MDYDKRNPTGRYWCFTVNNPLQSDRSAITDLYPKCNYLVIGNEIGQEGTPHIQGYVQYEPGVRFNWLRERLPRAHLERARGSALQNRDYCTKDGDFKEYGIIKLKNKSGERTDLAEIKKLLDECNLEKVKECYFPQWVRYRKSFVIYLQQKQLTHERSYAKRRFKTQVNVIHGAPDTGKTRKFWDENENMDVITFHNGFIIGYTGAPVVLFDDFDSTRVPRGLFLQLTDRYPMTINVKGDSMEWNPRVINITSNIHPNCWYGSNDLSVLRRLSSVITLDNLVGI